MQGGCPENGEPYQVGKISTEFLLFQQQQSRHTVLFPLQRAMLPIAVNSKVLLIVLCIMNVLSALFVEMALQIKDRDLLIQVPWA